jgi:N-acetylmuramoyl-L-alanine amidase
LGGLFDLWAKLGSPVLVICLGASLAYANGRRPAPDVRETIFSGTSYLSVEDVARTMNGHLHWYPVSQRVDLTFQSHNVQFLVGSESAVVDGQPGHVRPAPRQDDRGLWVTRNFFQEGPLARYFLKRIEFPVSETRESQAPPVPQAAPGRAAPPVPVSKPPASQPIPHAIRRIVIDPGHGGKDPGTVGTTGTEEKTVNLWMAQELADALRAKDYEVLLTRTDDSYIPLAGRAELANKYRADLFVSLHCNASLSSRLNGFEVYFLSEKASDPHADAVARMENASLALEGKMPSRPVQVVLRSLMKNANINKASQLGAIIERAAAQQLSQLDRGVKQAGFYVLRDAQMPAILIEMGFLSNREEERRLRNPAYRERMVRAIETGILQYDERRRAKARGSAG